MTKTHNALYQLRILWETLNNVNSPVGFFIGAGGPCSIIINNKRLIPDISKMTEIINQKITKLEIKESYEIVLEHLSLSSDEKNPDIEKILSMIRDLRRIAGDTEILGLTGKRLQMLDEVISKEIVELAKKSLPKKETSFDYLAMWISSVNRTVPIEIFTTNYDLLIEQSFERYKIPFFDGFIGSQNAFFDIDTIETGNLPKNWARVWKIHGSINWFLHEDTIIRSYVGYRDEAVVIHPSHLKYDESRRMPYLVILDQLKSFLAKNDAVLIISGFSFRDDHINEIIIQGLNRNRSSVVFALFRGNLTKYQDVVELFSKVPNFNIIAKDQAVISLESGMWELTNQEIPENLTEIITDIEIKDQRKVEVLIGDFHKFGLLLRSIIGLKEFNGNE